MKIDFIKFLTKQAKERYKTCIVYSKPLLGKTNFAKNISKSFDCSYVDFLKFVIDKESLKNNIDIFFPNDFKENIKKIETVYKNKYIFIDNIDFLLNSWTQRDLKEFLNIIDKYNSKKVIVFFVQDRDFLHNKDMKNTYKQNRILDLYKLKQFKLQR